MVILNNLNELEIQDDDGFNFDLVGNIMKILNRVTDCGISGTTLGSDALDREFEYDPLYRVVSANGRESDTQDQNDYLYSDAPIPGSPNADNVRAYERQYSYDKLGNIQQLKQLGTNGFTRDFSYFSNKNTLEKIENATPSVIESFTYDNVGNQITAGTTRNYVWNAPNQLITYYNQAGSNDPTIFAQYDYDGGGNRVSKLVRTGTAGSPVYERTVYIDGIFEYHILENGTTYEKNYVHVMDDQSRIAMVRIGDQFPDDISDSVTYNLEDQIGSSSMRLNTSGGVVDKEEYYPFGDSSLRTFSKKRYRYVGKEKDLESGLYYYGARYYAAWTCRFISVDPLAADYVHLTPYNNAGNKVVNSVDIDGMQGENEPKTGGNDKNVKGHQQEDGTYDGHQEVEGVDIVGKKSPSISESSNSYFAKNSQEYYDKNNSVDIVDSLKNLTFTRSEPADFYIDTRQSIADVPLDNIIPGDVIHQSIYPSSATRRVFPDYREFTYLGDGEFELTKKFDAEVTAGILVEGAMYAVPVGRIFKVVGGALKMGRAAKTSKWVYGSFKSSTKWANQLAKRGWTEKQVGEAISKGKQFKAVNNVNKANGATRYVHPKTGQSVVTDNVTNELLHVGGPGFKY